MARSGATFDTVRRIALALPNVEESTMYGAPALKLGGRLVACVPSHKSAEPGSLAVRTEFAQRDALIEEDPATYYVTDHYAGHPIVLVRLSRTNTEQLRDLLASACRAIVGDSRRKRRAAGSRRS